MTRQAKQHQPKPEATVVAGGMGVCCVAGARIEANGDPRGPAF